MESLAARLDRLYVAAHKDVAELQAAVAAHGIDSSPALRLIRGHEYSYDAAQEAIHVLIPDLNDPLGELFLLYLESLLSCPDADELLDLLTLLQAFGVAHEFAHHLRHAHGRFNSANLWGEEKWANYFAAAYIRPRLSPAQLDVALHQLHRAVTGLVNAERRLDHLVDPDHARLFFDTTEEKSPTTYLFYTLGWIYLSLASSKRQCITRFVAEGLRDNRTAPHAPAVRFPVSPAAFPVAVL